MGGDCDAMILAAVQATFWPIRFFCVFVRYASVQATFWPIRGFGVYSLCLFVLTRFTCGNGGKIPCVLVLTCAIAVATE